MYYSICPLCQEVCKYNKYITSYFCYHEKDFFRYEAIVSNKKKNFCEIHLGTNNYIMKLNLNSKTSVIMDLNDDKKTYHLSFLTPIDWNNFEIDIFEDKLNKIIQYQIFD